MKKFKNLKLSKSKKLRFIDNYFKKKLYIVFLHGFKSDLEGDKPKALYKFCKKNNIGFLTLEYSGHGKSYGKLNFVSENNIKFARMAGNVTTENNGGFIQFRAELSYKLKDESNGIKLTVRGNNQDYFVHIRTCLLYTSPSPRD